MPIEMPKNQMYGDYTPEEDVYLTQENGIVLQIAHKGLPMPMSEAVRLELVKEPKAQGPSEVKTEPEKPYEPVITHGKPPVSEHPEGAQAPYGAERAPAAAPATDVPSTAAEAEEKGKK